MKMIHECPGSGVWDAIGKLRMDLAQTNERLEEIKKVANREPVLTMLNRAISRLHGRCRIPCFIAMGGAFYEAWKGELNHCGRPYSAHRVRSEYDGIHVAVLADANIPTNQARVYVSGINEQNDWETIDL